MPDRSARSVPGRHAGAAEPGPDGAVRSEWNGGSGGQSAGSTLSRPFCRALRASRALLALPNPAGGMPPSIVFVALALHSRSPCCPAGRIASWTSRRRHALSFYARARPGGGRAPRGERPVNPLSGGCGPWLRAEAHGHERRPSALPLPWGRTWCLAGWRTERSALPRRLTGN